MLERILDMYSFFLFLVLLVLLISHKNIGGTLQYLENNLSIEHYPTP